ncbi:MAG: serine/threonine protein kinase, partial [Cyanobacteria bacterium]|nr:serine/threonine protein kinase [Cyanobacteriota bacterium]
VGQIVAGLKRQARVVKQLATKQLSAVYLVRLDNGELAIAKHFSFPENNPDLERLRTSFEREYELLSKLKNERLVSVLDAYSDDQSSVLLLEHAPGRNLRELVDEDGTLGEMTVVQIARQLCQVLSYLHSQSPPVVHRDLTPDNIVLNENGKIMLIDFGAAHQFLEGITGTLIGKQCYVAPEQLRGHPGPESDMYAFGATLYFLLTGKDPTALSRSDPGCGVSATLRNLIMRATNLDIKERPVCFDDVLQLLDHQTDSQECSAKPPLQKTIIQLIRPWTEEIDYIQTVQPQVNPNDSHLSNSSFPLHTTLTHEVEEHDASSVICSHVHDSAEGQIHEEPNSIPETVSSSRTKQDNHELAKRTIVSAVLVTAAVNLHDWDLPFKHSISLLLCCTCGLIWFRLLQEILPEKYRGDLLWFVRIGKLPAVILAALTIILEIPFKLFAGISLLTVLVAAFVLDRDLNIPARWTERLPLARHLKNNRELWATIKRSLRSLRPFLFAGVYLAAAPVSAFIMFLHWIKPFFSQEVQRKKAEDNKLLLRQNIPNVGETEPSFFNSRAFSITLLTVFVLGLPALATVLCYNHLGISSLLESTKTNWINTEWTVGDSSYKSPVQMEHVRQSLITPDLALPNVLPKQIWWNGNFSLPNWLSSQSLSNVTMIKFGIFAYIMSLGWCISTLFMRAFFTFPLNYTSTEYDIEINKNGVEQYPVKGWLAELVWYCWPSLLPRALSWSEVKSISLVSGGIGRLSPLPEKIFSRDSLVYRGLNRLAAYIDAAIDRLGREQYLSFGTLTTASFMDANEIRVRLRELDNNDRVRLLYAIRKYAPHLYIPSDVQERLVGTTVMKEAKYSEIWFDMLMTEKDRKRRSALASGDVLEHGITVLDKIGAGGQATVYLAKDGANSLLVLKE